MGILQDLQLFLATCRRALIEDCPGFSYLEKRGYSFKDLESLGLGFYRGSTALPLKEKALWGFLRGWGEGNPAIVYPLRTLGGELLGIQLGAIRPGEYKDFFSLGAGKRGLFFYPDNFDWNFFHNQGKVVLVEGCLDTCSLSLSVRCVLGCLSARVTPAQHRGLRRWAQEVYCMFDKDEAGERAAQKFLLSWDEGGSSAHRVRSLLKDPQQMLEMDRKMFTSWIMTWAPPGMVR